VYVTVLSWAAVGASRASHSSGLGVLVSKHQIEADWMRMKSAAQAEAVWGAPN
jgi:hypothetical protein